MTKTYEIIHIESKTVLHTIKAEKFTLDEHGIVAFHLKGSIIGATQVSASTIIQELVVPTSGKLILMSKD